MYLSINITSYTAFLFWLSCVKYVIEGKMQLKKELGKNIQKFRKFNKLTQEKLAELVNVEINSISSIETGKYFPSPDNIVKIASALNVSVADLFSFKEDYSCDDYLKEIYARINLVKNDKSKLSAINSFIKMIV